MCITCSKLTVSLLHGIDKNSCLVFTYSGDKIGNRMSSSYWGKSTILELTKMRQIQIDIINCN